MLTGWIYASRAKEKPTNSERILSTIDFGAIAARSLFSRGVARAIEESTAAELPAHALIQRAGLSIARFAMAIAPHSGVIWIPCGPGNNGGDGFEAAVHLKHWGKTPVVTCLSRSGSLPADAAATRRRALQAGVTFSDERPDHYDLCIDALFGIGHLRGFDDRCVAWIKQINSGAAPVIAVDLPSGLDADTGAVNTLCVKADFTLSLLTLKPGLFTANGRDACGAIWFNALGVPEASGACAQLNGTPLPLARPHNSHKGSYGDVGIVGGASGMAGAALLAAKGALHGGAGRVYVCLLDASLSLLDIDQPELMFRKPAQLAYEAMTVVAGCGGGDSIHAHLGDILARSSRLVLDADALNHIAMDPALQDQLTRRIKNTTVLTPHPLEAARLLDTDSKHVQSNRLEAAQALADRFGATVVLKGSGTVIAAPETLTRINPTGNARLATAGTGDVLAGLIGAQLAAGGTVLEGACQAVFRHGHVADLWCAKTTMTAQDLSHAL